jgi:hypothetical protein
MNQPRNLFEILIDRDSSYMEKLVQFKKLRRLLLQVGKPLRSFKVQDQTRDDEIDFEFMGAPRRLRFDIGTDQVGSVNLFASTGDDRETFEKVDSLILDSSGNIFESKTSGATWNVERNGESLLYRLLTATDAKK